MEYENRRDADDAYHEMHNKRIGRDDLLKIEVCPCGMAVERRLHLTRTSGLVRHRLLRGASILAERELVMVAVRVVARVAVTEAAIEAIVVTDRSALAVASGPPVVAADLLARAVVPTPRAKTMFALDVSATMIAAIATARGVPMATAK